MSTIIPLLIIVLILGLAAAVIVSRSKETTGVVAKEQKQGKQKPSMQIPSVSKVSRGFVTFLKFIWVNAWKAFLLVVAVLIVWSVFSWATTERTHHATVMLSRAPYSVTVEAGDVSDTFMLYRNGAWNAHVDPCSQIRPYIIFVNGRMINGVLYFDGFRVENTSGGPLVFRTWQERPREGHVPSDCT